MIPRGGSLFGADHPKSRVTLPRCFPPRMKPSDARHRRYGGCVHGHRQLSLFNAHYDERCFLPIHVYDTATSRPVAVLLRPGKTPSGIEVRGHLRRLVRRIRRHWPTTKITLRGDGHGACPGEGGGPARGHRMVRQERGRLYLRPARQPRARPAGRSERRRHSHPPRARPQTLCARLRRDQLPGEILEHRSPRLCPDRGRHQGPRHPLVVTSIQTGSAEHLYQTLYCARGQAENLIKLHKAQLASDRTSCRSPLANQMRLILHTAAYWLMLTVRDAIPKTHALATAEFTTIRLRLLKLGARVIEMASRVRLAFAAACPDAPLIRHIAAALMPAGP